MEVVNPRILSEVLKGDTIYLIQNEEYRPVYIPATVEYVMSKHEISEEHIIIQVVINTEYDNGQLCTFVTSKFGKESKDVTFPDTSKIFATEEDAKRYVQSKREFLEIKPFVSVETGDKIFVIFNYWNKELNVEVPKYYEAQITKIHNRDFSNEKIDIEFDFKSKYDKEPVWAMATFKNENSVISYDFDCISGLYVTISEKIAKEKCDDMLKENISCLESEIARIQKKIDYLKEPYEKRYY